MQDQPIDAKLINCLNVLIRLHQWDESLPRYVARLYSVPDEYEKALASLRKPLAGESPAGNPGKILTDDEWQKLYQRITNTPALNDKFAAPEDPFKGVSSAQLSQLAEIADLNTNPQTIFYSRNATFYQVWLTVRQKSELDVKTQIEDGLYKFYAFLDTNKDAANTLYKLACSDAWHSVLASLREQRDYVPDDRAEAKQVMKDWNQKLSPELRSILLKPTNLDRVPKKLVTLAWEHRDLFEKALKQIPADQRPDNKSELRQKVSNAAYVLLLKEAKEQLEAVEEDLKTLAVVALYCTRTRKFAKLDGLVYAWPNVAVIAMADYSNLKFVEKFFVEPIAPPTEEELEKKRARELYDLCKNDPSLIRFLRLQPHFSEIDDNQLRRYHPLEPVTGKDPTQPTSSDTTTATFSVDPNLPVPMTAVQSRVCELVIKSIPSATFDLQETQYEVSLRVSDQGFTSGRTTFSTRQVLDKMLHALGVTSEDSLHSELKNLFSGTNAEQVLVRAGARLFNSVIVNSGLEPAFVAAFEGDQPVRLLIIPAGDDRLHFLPWEWFPRPRPGYAALLLAEERFSLVRSKPLRSRASAEPLARPLGVLGLFPNTPVGSRDVSENSTQALSSFANEGVFIHILSGELADTIHLDEELSTFAPQIIHFEGYIDSSRGPSLWFSGPGSVVSVGTDQFGSSLRDAGVQLLVIARNEGKVVYENPVASVGRQLVRSAVPAVLAPIRAVDEVTASALIAEFYRAFFAGHTLERALYIARRKIAAKGGDWTSFALFADPWALDFFQPLPTAA